MSRQLIVVDLETTGLHDDAAILEVAAVNVDTGDELYFVPFVMPDKLTAADPYALKINRYFERGVFEETLRSDESLKKFDLLADMLAGNTFGGSNPKFDAQFVANAQKSYGPIGEVWHHRLADLSAFAAGVLGLPPTDLPGLDKVCKHLGVDNECAHSALADARATAECFKKLMLKGNS